MERVKLSVHRVVDWVLRCGDIDSRYVDASTMQQGAAAHRKIQKAMTGDYRKEVSLSLETEAGGFPLLLQGRADGVFTAEDGLLTIDEIKSTTLPLKSWLSSRLSTWVRRNATPICSFKRWMPRRKRWASN